LRALPTLNRRRLLNRWTAASTIRSVTSRESFPEAVSRAARCLTADLPGPRTLDLGWLAGLRMPVWAASGAVQAVQHLLQSASAEGADPLADDRAVHLMLASLHGEGSTMRHLNAAVTATGVGWEAPFLDDRVVEAALCVQVSDRFGEAGSFKPVLAAAAAGVVPPEILRRRDKGEFSAEMYHGLRRNREGLLELCRESQLAALGLVDAAGLRAAILDPGPTPEDLIPLEVTVGLEGWLRSPAVAAGRSGGGAPEVPVMAGRQC
jgi:asparagine synthase (glutamine-hydrolysing)